ncbi:uncharacterized protein DFL_000466 [Arthrobotrys flagrans]|uniref:Uncharacterized protein n=1 Tax=Arthrobotrys flagrans TaxID=97331 RepID=A0A437ADV3_ARTFL|nr:hypothetical protein DFL_000466 [Arthrobotrys flagrans]
MSGLLDRHTTKAAHECYKTQVACESALSYGRFGHYSSGGGGWNLGELELIEKSSKGRATVVPRVLRPTLAWEIEHLELLEELRRFKGYSTEHEELKRFRDLVVEALPTEQTYSPGELNWNADRHPQIRFQNGNYIHFQPNCLLGVFGSDGKRLASTGVQRGAQLLKNLKLFMREDGYLIINEGSAQLWFANCPSATKLVFQQNAPYIRALNVHGQELWKIET